MSAFSLIAPLWRVPVAAGTLHPSLATGLQGVSRLSDIDRRDLLVVPNPAAPDALERRLLLAVPRASMPAVLAWQLWLVPIVATFTPNRMWPLLHILSRDFERPFARAGDSFARSLNL